MKVILSRKGFDSKAGGIINPILPDGTLLSFPIPSADSDTYMGLRFRDIEYNKILCDLGYVGKQNCHLDPDIRMNIRKEQVFDWKPAFGQIDAAERYLENSQVEEGDIFLFFGRFRRVELIKGKYRYIKPQKEDFYLGNPVQIIFGYLQIGQILKEPQIIQQYEWHPHAAADRLNNKTNALYIPTKFLSFAEHMPGYGVFNYDKKRILTKEGCTPAKWIQKDFYMPNHVVGNRKNSGKQDELYYKGQWQELVINESDGLMDWLKYIFA